MYSQIIAQNFSLRHALLVNQVKIAAGQKRNCQGTTHLTSLSLHTQTYFIDPLLRTKKLEDLKL